MSDMKAFFVLDNILVKFMKFNRINIMTVVLIKKIIRIIVLAYLGFGMLLFFGHRNMIYHPNHPTKTDFFDCKAFTESEKININRTRAYYKHNSNKIIVVYGGNAGSACDRAFLRSAFGLAGYSYLFVEYTGYTGCEKKPSKKAILSDVRNVVGFLEEKKYIKTMLFAESIGTGPASYHISLFPPDKALFISPFDSLENVAQAKFFFFPISIVAKFSKENYKNIPLIKDFEGKLRVIHGTEDNIIPIRLGKAFFMGAQKANKDFIEIEGAGHNNIYLHKKTWKYIKEFLSTN